MTSTCDGNPEQSVSLPVTFLDRLALVAKGRIVAEQPTDDLRTQEGGELRQESPQVLPEVSVNYPLSQCQVQTGESFVLLDLGDELGNPQVNFFEVAQRGLARLELALFNSGWQELKIFHRRRPWQEPELGHPNHLAILQDVLDLP